MGGNVRNGGSQKFIMKNNATTKRIPFPKYGVSETIEIQAIG